ncbi:MAG: 50S ribosomal protein L1 [Candidatus Omnitrophica bacterium]|nr:50S ribosomal protein L1 [Candidatus Omnitrophota bacterium]
MAKLTKKQKAASELIEQGKEYTLQEGVKLVKELPAAQFDESVEFSLKLGIDPKQSDQLVRGTIIMPHGTGKKVRVVVFCKGEEAKAAQAAGAEYVGAEDLIKKISTGWVDFDVAVASPDMMRDLSKLGKVLGPRGLMPNPKAGTVTKDVGKAVEEVKKGKIEFKADKSGDIRVAVGKKSFSEEALLENINALITAILRAQPSAAKGQYLRSIYISSTMCPGICLDPNKL